jgi:carboxyl-terminal processing protease
VRVRQPRIWINALAVHGMTFIGMRNARILGLAVVAAAVLPLAACQRSSPTSLAPRVYLNSALLLMQENAVAGGRVDWKEVDRRARELTANAKTPAQTYSAIEYALSQLQRAGDGHASFFDPAAAKAGGVRTRLPHLVQPLPTVAARGKIGIVTLPSFEASFSSAWARRYLTKTLSAIALLQQQRHPCGWIVNLDEDLGGNGWAMVLSVGPIIGNGRVFGFTGRKGFVGWASYRVGVISGLGNSLRAPVRVPTIRPAPPVAVLTGADTASGGELVAVAFRGRPDTRSFGSATYGATNGPHVYRLADGAELLFGVNYYVDRDGHVYSHAILPNVPAVVDQEAATRWLLHTPACIKLRK